MSSEEEDSCHVNTVRVAHVSVQSSQPVVSKRDQSVESVKSQGSDASTDSQVSRERQFRALERDISQHSPKEMINGMSKDDRVRVMTSKGSFNGRILCVRNRYTCFVISDFSLSLGVYSHRRLSFQTLL